MARAVSGTRRLAESFRLVFALICVGPTTRLFSSVAFMQSLANGDMPDTRYAFAWASNVLEENTKFFDSAIGSKPAFVELYVPRSSYRHLLCSPCGLSLSYATWW
jgi:hypothetical protein